MSTVAGISGSVEMVFSSYADARSQSSISVFPLSFFIGFIALCMVSSLVFLIPKVISGTGSVKIMGNNLGGSVKLDDLAMSLKWSKIGNLRMYLIQPVMWTLVQTVGIPYANSYLGKGFPLPIIHGFTLQNAEIIFSSSKVTVCSNVSYSESDNLNQEGDAKSKDAFVPPKPKELDNAALIGISLEAVKGMKASLNMGSGLVRFSVKGAIPCNKTPLQ
ncbi:hypothetical protein Gohar_013090 [Gossypium harknessii]|uniref:Lipid-binding serum glycoprotein C-terminal domain-containing protein n=1 Tax=Gossypium harknessii TaxID=34285 RepID=A0A7J9GZ68_9ROSI|nr:hypothetical protein [Gossypium harknessii]